MGLAKELELLLKREKAKERRLVKEMKMLPPGELIIKKSGKYLFMYQKENAKEQGITKNRGLCIQLARKCFIKRQINVCRQSCRALKKALQIIGTVDRGSVSGTYRRLEHVFPEKRYEYSQKQLNWMFSDYERNPFKPEHLRYRTRSGIIVRSKAERINADFLTENGILFHYEEKLLINGYTYYPDFVIMRDDGSMVIWEHFGLMDNEEYFIKACAKLESYRRAGFATLTNLICTY